MGKKQDFKSLTRNELIDWFKKEKLQSFRGKQVFNWLYQQGIDNFNQMHNLPQKMRDSLSEKAYLTQLKLKEKIQAEDGTIKYLWQLDDGELIESVYLPYKERKSVCISSQVGCAMDCQFCATGSKGFKRNLTVAEIVDQVFQIEKRLNPNNFKDKEITNIVFMGIGEPLANLSNVLKAINIFNDKQGLNIGIRRITVSTSGLIPEIRKLANNKLQIVLAVSLNAPNNLLRNKLMPINKKYPLERLIRAVKEYIAITNRRVSFEYVLIKDLNDSQQMAYQLADLLKGLLCHVNLIPINSVKEYNLVQPSFDIINNFKNILIDKGIETSVRLKRGTGIEAACGQLRHLKD